MIRKIEASWWVLLFCMGAVVISKSYLKPFKSPSAHTYFVNPSPYLEHMTFGYRELVADLLWLRTIQDVDHCERPLKDKELCTHSWVFKMVDKVTDLSPQFRIIYATVPLLLAITVNDIQGAIELLDKGVRYFPNDWPILYRGGYLYLYERGDKTKAAEYFLRAQKSGGPDWLATLATRLYSESGRLEMVQQLVKEYEQLGFPPGLLARMRERLDEVSKTIK
jgi:hypothetical protein